MGYWRKKNNKENRIITEPKNMTPIMLYAEPMIDALIENGYESFILNDYEFVNEKKNYRFIDSQSAEKDLIPIMNTILGYLKLPLLIRLKVVLNSDENNNLSSQNKAGLYQGTWGNRTITINIGKEYSIWNVLAILCHECTHYFMEYNNLNWIDMDLNERRTDMMACIIGFSKIISKGYKQIESTRYIDGIKHLQTTRIGYLTDVECEELAIYLEYRRKLLVEKNKEKELFENEKKRVDELIGLIEWFGSQCEAVNPITHIDSYNNISKEGQEELQNAIIRYRGINYEGSLKRYSERLNTVNTTEGLEELLNSCEKTCAELQAVITVFQKHFC